MPENFIKNDLRVIKTYKVLLETLKKLLELHNFKRLTVNDICNEAQISRATFYAHFKDKYDLLNYWLKIVQNETISIDGTYEQIENFVNQFILNNQMIIRHILEDVNDETLLIVFEFINSTLNTSALKEDSSEVNPEYIVLSNMYAGGIISYINWQLRNKFPPQLPVMNIHLHKILKIFLECESETREV